MSHGRSLFSEGRPLLRLAWPIVAGLLGRMVQNLCDAVMLGHVGTAELAACAFGGNLSTPLLGMGWAMMSGLSVLVAEARGAQQPEKGRALLAAGWGLSWIIGLTMVVLGMLLWPTFSWWGQEASVVALAPAYFLPMVLSIAVVVPAVCLENTANALDRPLPPLIICWAAVLLNIGLNWVFIFGHWGCPAMGVAGAGWATFLARLAQLLGLWFWVHRVPEFRPWRPQRWWAEGRSALTQWTGPLLRLGIPASGASVVEILAFNAAALLSGQLGAVPLAAHHIALTCAGTTFMVPLGVSHAVSVRIGEATGGREKSRLVPIMRAAYLVGCGFMLMASLAYVVGGQWLAKRFSSDAATISLTGQLFLIAAWFQLADGAQVVSSGLLRGLKDTRFPALISVLAWWVLSLPAAYLWGITWNYGAQGIWWGLATGLAVAAVLLGLRVSLKLKSALAEMADVPGAKIEATSPNG